MNILTQNKWSRFWAWYERHTTESLLVTAIIIYIQIPHMVWNADLYLETGLNLARQNVVLDFLLYGIDLIEVLPMVNVGMILYSKLRAKNT